MTAAIPGREELIHSISHLLSGHSFALITGGHHEEMASKIVDRVIERLAAKPADDPERASKDARLAVEVREGMIEKCANIALAIDSGRGNEKEIAKAIRSLSTTGEPKR